MSSSRKAKGGGLKPPVEEIYPCEFVELATLKHKGYTWQNLGEYYGVHWKVAKETWLAFCADETGKALELDKVER